MECLSLNHLHVDGGSGWTAGSSLQKPECQVQDETSTSKVVPWFLQVHIYKCTCTLEIKNIAIKVQVYVQVHVCLFAIA